MGPVINYLQKPPKLTIKPLGEPGNPGKIEVEGMEPRVYAIPTLEEFRVGTGNAPAPVDPSWLAAMAARSSGSGTTGGYNLTVSYFPPIPRSPRPSPSLRPTPLRQGPS